MLKHYSCGLSAWRCWVVRQDIFCVTGSVKCHGCEKECFMFVLLVLSQRNMTHEFANVTSKLSHTRTHTHTLGSMMGAHNTKTCKKVHPCEHAHVPVHKMRTCTHTQKTHGPQAWILLMHYCQPCLRRHGNQLRRMQDARRHFVVVVLWAKPGKWFMLIIRFGWLAF